MKFNWDNLVVGSDEAWGCLAESVMLVLALLAYPIWRPMVWALDHLQELSDEPN